MPLTLDEAERRAYMAGDTALADAIARSVEGDDLLAAQAQHWEERADSNQRLADSYCEDLGETQQQLAEANTRLETLRANVIRAASSV